MVLVLVLTAVANAGCNNNWNWWWVGTRTQWNVTKDFYIGLDVAYTKIRARRRQDGLLLRSLPGGYQHRSQDYHRHGQLAGALPRASRLLSVIV